MYKPVKLPYDYSALEPYIDVETMKVHYDTLYMNYINKFQKCSSLTVLKLYVRII